MKNSFPAFILTGFFALYGLAMLLGQNLTSVWQDNHGTKYAIRQAGNDIFRRLDRRPGVRRNNYFLVKSRITKINSNHQ